MILSVKTCRRTIQTIASCTAAAGETMPLYPDISWECNLNSKSMNDVNRRKGERREGGGKKRGIRKTERKLSREFTFTLGQV